MNGERVNSPWHYSTADLLVYVAGWALLSACFTVEQSNDLAAALSLLGLLTLPGALVCGTIGYAVGGRRLFRPAALCGTSVWMFANVIPVIVKNFSR